jgi:hypothetical protein
LLGNDRLDGGNGNGTLEGGGGTRADRRMARHPAAAMATTSSITTRRHAEPGEQRCRLDSWHFGRVAGINLALYGFEQAPPSRSTRQTAWSSMTDARNQGIRSETLYDNGTSTIVEYDVANQYSWSTRTRTYNAQGTMTGETLVADGGGGDGQTTNAKPTDLSLSASAIIEGAAAGTAIGTLSASDPTGETFTYSSQQCRRSFRHQQPVVVASAALLDYEAASHAITVR